MPDVFRFFQNRLPRKAAVQRVVSRGISIGATTAVGGAAQQARNTPFLLAMTGVTIGTGSASGTNTAKAPPPLSDTLRAACEAQDIDQFIRVASDFYLTSAIRRLSDLLPISQAAYALFEGMGPIMQAPPVDRFFEEYADATMVGYLQNDLPGELTRVGDSMLAAEALRLHGAQRGLSYTRMLKALYGLAMAHKLRAHHCEQWSIAPLIQLFQMPVFVPGWVWDLDPCDWLMTDSPDGTVPPQGGATELATSELIKKRKAIALYRETRLRPPDDKLCDCKCDDSCIPQSPCCAEIKSFVTDLLIVRETLQSYLPADIAYIENVLGGEIRVRKHESLLQIEQTQQTETTVTSSQELDHQVSERAELSTQAENTTQEDVQAAAGVTYTQKWGVPAAANGSVTATASFSTGTSTSTAEMTARNYARDVVDRSVSKIEKSVRELVSRSVLSRTREMNKHVFNRSGQDLTVGIYTYVNKALKAQVYTHGRRMVYEFILPDPAAMYKTVLIKAFGLDETFLLKEPPVPPNTKDISPSNYLAYVNSYGVDDAPAPPELTKTIKQGFGGDPGSETHTAGSGWTYKDGTQPVTIVIPAGYVAKTMSAIPITLEWNGHTNDSAVAIHLGAAFLVWRSSGVNVPGPVNLPNLEGNQAMVGDYYHMTKWNVEVSIVCELKPEGLIPWQREVHKLLLDAYTKQKEAYDAAKATYDAARADKMQAMQDSIRNRDPFFNREIERTELKRLAISWLSCQFFDQFNAVKKRVQPCGLPQMNLREAEVQSEVIRFWEQALDWNLMTYLFYPYFWSSKCTWTEKIVEDTGDALFDKFMQSGAARAQIPVAEGFEECMLYWEKTGQIWGQDGEPPRSDTDSHWISMVEEIRHQQGCYLNDREGRIDTNPPSEVVTIKGSDRYWDPVLQIVDANAIALDIDREIDIDAVIYRIVAISPNSSSPPYDVNFPDSMWWDVSLDRPYEGVQASSVPYAVGAKYIGAPWIVTVPTNLVWLKNDTYCLPSYPLTCKGP